MTRAGIFIGVDRAGNLPQLMDGAAGARRMYEWALAQGMNEGTHAKLITDEGGQEVSSDQICNAVEKLVNGPGVDQLIIYFAGHGVNINRNEHWLLTRAPERTSAAINVSGSVELARYCGIQHAVIISDACRVAPEGIQAQNVRGVDMFPNSVSGDRAQPVDQFFACFLGRTAAEIIDPTVAASNYRALYTTALHEALSGRSPEALEANVTDNCQYVKPRKLQKLLEYRIPLLVKSMGLQNKVNQNPDAIITSDPDKDWLSRLEISLPEFREKRSMHGIPDIDYLINLGYIPKSTTLVNLTGSVVKASLEGSGLSLEQAKSSGIAGAKDFIQTALNLESTFGPDHFETGCGVKVRGEKIIDFFLPGTQAELFEENILRVYLTDYKSTNVLLRFTNHSGTIVPILSGFITALTFEDGELIDVVYEPSANHWRWNEYAGRATEIRELRAIAASSSQHSRFRLDHVDQFTVARKMQLMKSFDPTLSIYAAYSYHDLQMLERISEMSMYQKDDLGVTFFDLALLSKRLVGKRLSPDDRIVPFTPMLSQGWALIKAHRVILPPELADIEVNLIESLWSLYDAAGLEKLRRAMQTNNHL